MKLWGARGTSLDLLSKYLFIMDFRFNAMLWPTWVMTISDAAHNNFHAVRSWPVCRRFPTPEF